MLIIGVLVSVAALHNFGRRPQRAQHAQPSVELPVLTEPPDVVTGCPGTQNCLATSGVPSNFSASIVAFFPAARITSTASVFDARIPEVDELQAVGTLASGHLVFTVQRVSEAATESPAQRRTTLADGGVMVAALRGMWVVSVVVSGAIAADAQAAASDWIKLSPLPR